MGSIFNQTRLPGELLVVDDGSTDNTRKVVEQAASRSVLPVRYFFQKNRGPSAARNVGILNSRGDILCFLDSDDWWDPDKISLQWNQFRQQPETLIAHTREIWFRKGVRVNQKKKHSPGNGYIFSSCLAMCVVGMSTVMVRRRFFERYGMFDESLPCCEDYDLWLRSALETPFFLVDRPLTLKEGGRGDQLSTRYRQGMDRFRIQSLCNLLESGRLTFDQYTLALSELERKCVIYGKGCIKHGREAEGQTYLSLPQEYRNLLPRVDST